MSLRRAALAPPPAPRTLSARVHLRAENAESTRILGGQMHFRGMRGGVRRRAKGERGRAGLAGAGGARHNRWVASGGSWTFLTHHAHVLVAVADNNDVTLAEIARIVGISERSAVTILNNLVAEGYVERERRGRRNHYTVRGTRPLRHPSNADHTIGDLIGALSRVSISSA